MMFLNISDVQDDSAGYEQQSCNRNKSCNLIKQCMLFYKTSIFKTILVGAGGVGRLPDLQALFLFLLEHSKRTNFAYFNLIKFLTVPGDSKTICRSEDGVSLYPTDRWWAHAHSLFFFQAPLAVRLSGSAQASSAAEASVSWFPKALSKIKLKWLSMYLIFPSRSTGKDKPSFLVKLTVFSSGLGSKKMTWEQNNNKKVYNQNADCRRRVCINWEK